MQEVLSGREDRKAVHRSYSGVKDRLHLRTALHRMRYLPEKMSFRGDNDHQPADQSRDSNHPQIFRQQFQIASTSDAETGSSPRPRRYEWYREIHGFEDFEWKVEAGRWPLDMKEGKY